MSLDSVKDYVTYEVSWNSLSDCCPKCLALSGETWNVDDITGILEHPTEGPVYDLEADVSLIHNNCRCFLTFTPVVEIENSEYFKIVQSNLNQWGYMPSNIEEAKQQVKDLDRRVQTGSGSIRQWEFALMRLNMALARLGLGKDIEATLRKLMRVIMLARQAQLALYALEAASGPVGWAYFGVTGITFLLTGAASVGSISSYSTVADMG